MAEIDNKIAAETAFEAEEVVVIEEQWNTIPPNRPRKVYSGMWGVPEIGAVAASFMVVLLALVVYFFWAVPAERELAKNRAQADRLETELISNRDKFGKITDSQTQVAAIVESIDSFEARFLPVSANGQAALYQRLNALIMANGLVNTSGPDYVPLEMADANGAPQPEDEKGRSKFRSLYPGVYVTTTLEGSYQNLRRFIREIETGREFVIVSAVELAPVEGDRDRERRSQSNETPPAQNPYGMPGPQMGGQRPMTAPVQPVQPQASERSKGKMHGEFVALRIELAAYFRRPVMAPIAQ